MSTVFVQHRRCEKRRCEARCEANSAFVDLCEESLVLHELWPPLPLASSALHEQARQLLLKSITG